MPILVSNRLHELTTPDRFHRPFERKLVSCLGWRLMTQCVRVKVNVLDPNSCTRPSTQSRKRYLLETGCSKRMVDGYVVRNDAGCVSSWRCTLLVLQVPERKDRKQGFLLHPKISCTDANRAHAAHLLESLESLVQHEDTKSAHPKLS